MLSDLRHPLMPVKFKRLYPLYHGREFRLLDIGCGNNSASKAKKYFPRCRYHGLDRTRDYRNSEADFALMDRFYEADLEKSALENLPEDFFDVVLLNHVIEHLQNGLTVLSALAAKVRSGGHVYIEFPNVHSLSLPNAVGTLNFSDDPTHVRLYTVQEIGNVLLQGGFRLVRAGRRRDWARSLLFPLGLLHNGLRSLAGKPLLTHGGLLDGFGFADFVFAQKK